MFSPVQASWGVNVFCCIFFSFNSLVSFSLNWLEGLCLFGLCLLLNPWNPSTVTK